MSQMKDVIPGIPARRSDASPFQMGIQRETAGVSERILYVLRGLPGSGKSTLAQRLGEAVLVFSTDAFFMEAGTYCFAPERLEEAHAWNQQRAREAMERGHPRIAIDNTHVALWEARPYTEQAVACGYRIEILEPDTPWKFDLPVLALRNGHGATEEVLRKMHAQWETDFTVERILAASRPVRSEMHDQLSPEDAEG